jgi:hypothetical protein
MTVTIFFSYTASNGECFMQSHCRRPFSIQSQWRWLSLHNKHVYSIHLKLRTLKNLSDVFDTLRWRYIKIFIKYFVQLFKLAWLKIDNLVSHLQSIFILWDKENNSNMYISNLFCLLLKYSFLIIPDSRGLHQHKHKHILLINLGPSRGIPFTYKERRSKFIAKIQYTFRQSLEHIFSNNIILWLGTTPTLHLV